MLYISDDQPANAIFIDFLAKLKASPIEGAAFVSFVLRHSVFLR
jgi:hypothetical protein